VEQLKFDFYYDMKPEVARILSDLKESLKKVKTGKEQEIAVEIYLKFIEPLITIEKIKKSKRKR
jgi:hypothetical protein